MKAIINNIKSLKPNQAAVLALYYSSLFSLMTALQADSREWQLMWKDDDGDDVFDDCRAVITACLDQAYQWGKDAAHSFPRAAMETVVPFRSLPDPWDILESLKDSWFEGYQDGDYDNRRDAYEAHEARCF